MYRMGTLASVHKWMEKTITENCYQFNFTYVWIQILLCAVLTIFWISQNWNKKQQHNSVLAELNLLNSAEVERRAQ